MTMKIFLIFLSCFTLCCFAKQRSTLHINVTEGAGRKIPDTFFGAFFEEINHAGAGGLWAELVRNRGFEEGGSSVPSNIFPWAMVGDDSTIQISTDRSSCFDRNKVALRMDVLCDGPKSCPPDGVGISNPGFWGMNIEKTHKYKVVFFAKASGVVDLRVSFVGSDNTELASNSITSVGHNVTEWTRMETVLEAKATNHNASLQITTSKKGVLWLDQVSAMPLDTFKGHGFRKDLAQRVAALKPKFFRFPGGCYVEGGYMRNAFRWKDSVGAWEERPGHFGDVWSYWTDDGFGYFEGLQIYTNANDMFSKHTKFDDAPRYGPKAFVSEYAVWQSDAGNGTLLAAVAEAAFLIGLEKNSDVVHMVSYAPLFVNKNDRRWTPDAIVFDSHQSYGTPSYWIQHLFSTSSGATLLDSTLESTSDYIVASAIEYRNPSEKKMYLRIKVVNFDSDPHRFRFSISGVDSKVKAYGATRTVITGPNVKEENSFSEPNRIVPQHSSLKNASSDMTLMLPPYSLTSLDLFI
ncbi:hypothetical protein VIGAN_04251000 [Vigna angularis var. angularis]|uniref:non-reducing end alpha-L-arabinofuranosidase n=1 Tax=Vigna angularis var. angularis TaxID=157739 RepID=A0A0S3RWR0_PHAAN|nr:hypothetical protein VIGAN_04251000 [Vigna angularis var. angularis]